MLHSARSPSGRRTSLDGRVASLGPAFYRGLRHLQSLGKRAQAGVSVGDTIVRLALQSVALQRAVVSYRLRGEAAGKSPADDIVAKLDADQATRSQTQSRRDGRAPFDGRNLSV